jgi:hypothetical protein
VIELAGCACSTRDRVYVGALQMKQIPVCISASPLFMGKPQQMIFQETNLFTNKPSAITLTVIPTEK